MPDETTILRFRRVLETHRLTQSLFDDMAALYVLTERGLLLRRGKIVDTTLIAAHCRPRIGVPR